MPRLFFSQLLVFKPRMKRGMKKMTAMKGRNDDAT